MESFVVRVYRREWAKGAIAGTVEEVGSGKRTAFQDGTGLLEAIAGGRRRKRRAAAAARPEGSA